MIHPETRDELPALRERFSESGSIRIERFLREEHAQDLLASLRQLPHIIKVPAEPGLQFLYYELELQPEESCDHITCRLARWLFGEGRTWLAELTGMTLEPPANGRLVATAYSKGSYLDPHNDVDGERALAYVLGLTPESWPAEQGGHLEFIDGSSTLDDLRITDRRAPGWNTLDIFDVRRPGRTHRIPIVTEVVERRAFSGWFYRR